MNRTQGHDKTTPALTSENNSQIESVLNAQMKLIKEMYNLEEVRIMHLTR